MISGHLQKRNMVFGAVTVGFSFQNLSSLSWDIIFSNKCAYIKNWRTYSNHQVHRSINDTWDLCKI